MDFLTNYGLFLVKLASLVIAILIIFSAFFGLLSKTKSKTKEKLEITKLNKRYEEYQQTITHTIKTKHELKNIKKLLKKEKKAESKGNIFVLNFHGDIRASAITALREEITAILTAANHEKDKVLVKLESPGGLVNAYGLAASQLQRIKNAKIILVISVDKMAASGGYMMACVADHIIAAPFAIIGSIGVVAQLPNFYRYLQQKLIDFEQLSAGEYKRTLSLFGENTDKGRHKMQQEIEETHALFKAFISQHRKQVDINQVATGEYWLGTHALDLKLIDALQTSDDYLLSTSKTLNLFEIVYKTKKPFSKRLAGSAAHLYHK